MPLQRRLPKVGFRSRKASSVDEVRLSELSRVSGEVVDLATLRTAGLVSGRVKRVKIIHSGDVDRALTIVGLAISGGAKSAIEAAGGKVVSVTEA